MLLQTLTISFVEAQKKNFDAADEFPWQQMVRSRRQIPSMCRSCTSVASSVREVRCHPLIRGLFYQKGRDEDSEEVQH